MKKDYFIYSVRHYVDKKTFACALTSHYWTKSEQLSPELSKRDAKKILKESLRTYGYDGVDRSHWDGADEEFMAPWEENYVLAIEWIEKNYPYLNQHK